MDFQQLIAQSQNPQLAAVTLRQTLKSERRSATGENLVYPATYDGGQYNIAQLPEGNICSLDSIPSQANRIEHAFMAAAYHDLMPQVQVDVEGVNIPVDKDKQALLDALGLSDIIKDNSHTRRIDMLEAPHRLADAAFRFSSLNRQILEAFLAFDKGDSGKIAQLSPFSLLFGAWDSHVSQIKIPRALTSEIVASNVSPQRRRGFYIARITGQDLAELKESAEVKTLSGVGLDLDNAGVGEEGVGVAAGVIVHGHIVRDASLNLVALRGNTRINDSTDKPQALQSYLFWLGMMALLMPQSPMLRQGCTLLPDSAADITLHWCDGRSEALTDISFDAVCQQTRQAAQAYYGNNMPSITTRFDRGMVGKLLAGKSSKAKK
jgi:CRISPR-associated protein Csb1